MYLLIVSNNPGVTMRLVATMLLLPSPVSRISLPPPPQSVFFVILTVVVLCFALEDIFSLFGFVSMINVYVV